MTRAVPTAGPARTRDREPAGLLRAFAAAARAHPQAPALQLGSRVYTYAEADATARCWAGALTEAVGGGPQRVGVFAYRSPVSYLGALAALYAGAAVVPLDRTLPVESTRTALASSGVDVLLADSASALQLPLVAPDPRVPVVAPLAEPSLCADRAAAGGRVLRRGDIPEDGAEPVPVGAGDPAYVFFDVCDVSARPVVFSHAVLRDLLRTVRARYAFGPHDRFAQVFDQSCDLSLFDLFAAWQAGGCVVPLRPLHVLDPARLVRRQEITVWFSSPVVAEFARQRRLLEPGSLPSLRWSLFGGGATAAAVADAWQEAAPGSAVECLHGPPGLPVAGAVHRWNSRVSPGLCVRGLVPLGRPFPGVRMALLDDAGEVDDEAGEERGGACGEAAGELAFRLPGGGWRRTGVRARRTADGEYLHAAAGVSADGETARTLAGAAAG